MHTSFQNQVGIITGAASGIGLAIAVRLSEKGVKLALFDRDEQGLKKISALLKTECQIYPLEITREQEIAESVAEVGKQFGRIDILINSAGMTGDTNIKSHEASPDQIRLVFEVNFMGSYLTSKYVLPWMIKNNYGRILHIASIAGKEGNAGMMAYSTSKAAVIALSKVQGKEYAESGITVNALAPAVIRTAMVEALPAEQVKYMTDKIPMKRCGTLDEVAATAVFIVSPESSFTTGFTYDLSGGRATY
ncbi:MAG: SDR family NAD(P)-dependent oxidoreductase [Chitinophagaceae bacterium]